jgi:streptogramin lyase
VTATYDVAPGWACGGSTFDGTDVWVTSGHDQADPCHEDGAWGVSRVDPATGVVTHVDVGGRPMDVAAGLGGVWVVTDKPHPALVRLDPATLRVVGRLALGAVPNITNPMAIGEGAIWIRVVDFWQDGMSPWPGMDRVSPSVLRIEPLG